MKTRATVREVCINGVRKCTCGRKLEMVAFRVGGLYAFFCCEAHARAEETRINGLRAAAGLQPIRDH